MIIIPDKLRRPAEVEREELRKQLAEARAEIERLKAPAMIADMREKMAALCHDQWAGWMEFLFLKSKQVDGCVIIPAWAVDRWRRQVATRYSDLSEDEKNSDRNEADRFLSLFNAEVERKDKLIEQMREALKLLRCCGNCLHSTSFDHLGADAQYCELDVNDFEEGQTCKRLDKWEPQTERIRALAAERGRTMKPRTGNECKKTTCVLHKQYTEWQLGSPSLNTCMNCKNAFVSQFKPLPKAERGE